jgi:limonene-1,2-epoxide hydrolase
MRGRDRIIKTLKSSMPNFDVKITNVAGEGDVVLTERIDALTYGPLRLQFWVCGTFEIRDGKIAVWRDYFDLFDFLVKAPLRGLLGIAVPRLRPSF